MKTTFYYYIYEGIDCVREYDFEKKKWKIIEKPQMFIAGNYFNNMKGAMACAKLSSIHYGEVNFHYVFPKGHEIYDNRGV